MMAAQPGAKANNFTNVIADADDDWDNEDSPAKDLSNKVNQRASDGMGFFNRGPLDAQPSASQKQPKATTMNNRQVPTQQQFSNQM